MNVDSEVLLMENFWHDLLPPVITTKLIQLNEESCWKLVKEKQCVGQQLICDETGCFTPYVQYKPNGITSSLQRLLKHQNVHLERKKKLP